MSSKRKVSKSNVRREAALRAWETRREEAKKRSDAAKKAWKSRRRSK